MACHVGNEKIPIVGDQLDRALLATHIRMEIYERNVGAMDGIPQNCVSLVPLFFNV